MGKIAKVIRDKRVLRLIREMLRAGAMLNGVMLQSVEGTPQGGPAVAHYWQTSTTWTHWIGNWNDEDTNSYMPVRG